ncbi:hypothetical protein X975_20568, partial [Stegodyphus mimosarum]
MRKCLINQIELVTKRRILFWKVQIFSFRFWVQCSELPLWLISANGQVEQKTGIWVEKSEVKAKTPYKADDELK